MNWRNILESQPAAGTHCFVTDGLRVEAAKWDPRTHEPENWYYGVDSAVNWSPCGEQDSDWYLGMYCVVGWMPISEFTALCPLPSVHHPSGED